MSAGKPLIVNSSGWTKDLVENNLCGFYYEYENFESFSKMIDEILIDTNRLLIKGKNSRSLAINLFDKEILTEKIVKLL